MEQIPPDRSRNLYMHLHIAYNGKKKKNRIVLNINAGYLKCLQYSYYNFVNVLDSCSPD